MLDTTGVIQPEFYIGIVLKTNPKVICYDDIGKEVSFWNIVFNDGESYMENGYIRKKIDGYYVFSRKPD